MTMRHKPKILHVLPMDGTGGAEIAARSGVNGDDSVHVHFLRAAPGSISEPNITHGSAATTTFSPQAVAEVVSLARELRPDVIVVSLWRSFPAFVALRTACPNARFVVLLHCYRPVSVIDRLLNAVMMRLSVEVWADAEQTLAHRLSKALVSRGRVVSFVTEKPKSVGLKRAAPRFVFWGRMVWEKGLDRAIDLINELRRSGIDAHYTIAGPDGGQHEALLDQVRRLEMEQHVEFVGPVSRDALPQIAAENTFYLQLSRWEGMAMSVVEAMQLGLVPVVSPVGGIVDYARDGSNALLHESVEHTAARVGRLLADPPLLKRLQGGAAATFADAPTYAESIRAAATALVRERG